jgi:hypothetical protein
VCGGCTQVCRDGWLPEVTQAEGTAVVQYPAPSTSAAFFHSRLTGSTGAGVQLLCSHPMDQVRALRRCHTPLWVC